MNPEQEQNQPQSAGQPPQPFAQQLRPQTPYQTDGQPTPTPTPTPEQLMPVPVVPQPAPADPQAPQPAMQSFAQPVANPEAPQSPVQPNQPKGLAIASLVLGILGFLTGWLVIGVLLGLIAVVLGIVSLVKHREGKGLAIAGIITGSIAVIFGGIFSLITLTAYVGIQDRAKTNALAANATNIAKSAEVYNANLKAYPTYDQLIQSDNVLSLEESVKNLHEGSKTSVNLNAPIAYESCGKGYAVHYWDDAAQSPVTVSASNYDSYCQ